MALTYRSPIEGALDSFTTSEQSLIASTAVGGYKRLEENNFQFFNYALSPHQKQKLIEAGLYLSPFSGVPHSHPCCKTLENHILYTVLPSYIDSTFYFVGIKERKLLFLKDRNSGLSACGLINRYVTSKDYSRYQSTFHASASEELSGNLRALSESSETLRSLIPPCISKNARNLFLHDEVHYWSTKDLKRFLGAVRPSRLLCTVVVPPEILGGCRQSLNPWCYEFKIQGKDLHFYPDGVRSEGYVQPMTCCELLGSNRVVLEDGTVYAIDMLHSVFSHHLISVTRTNALCEKERSFSCFEATTSTGLVNFGKKKVGPCLMIPFPVVSRIYRYLRTLMKPDMESAMAKLSQILPEPTAYQIKFVQEFSELVIKTPVHRSMLSTSFMVELGAFVTSVFPSCFAHKFQSLKIKSLDAFVRTMKPYCVDVKLSDYGSFIERIVWLDSTLIGIEPELDVVSKMERLYTGFDEGEQIVRQSRYTLEPYADEVEFNFRRLHNICLRFLRGMIYQGMELPSYSACIEVLKTAVRRSRLLELCLERFLQEPRELIKVYRDFCRVARRYVGPCPSSFAFSPMLWFSLRSSRRVNINYLDSVAHGHSTVYSLKAPWADVVRSLGACGANFIELEECKDLQGEITYRGEVDEGLNQWELSRRELDHLHVGASVKLTFWRAFGTEYLNLEACDQMKGREVSWFTRRGNKDYSYNGGNHVDRGWPEVLDHFMELNEISLDYYDCCLFQEYKHGGAIGFHKDDEDIFLNGGSIYTVSYDGDCVFGFKHEALVCEKDLSGAVKFEMPEGFQKTHYHRVRNCSEGRKSLTFRRLKRSMGPDVAPSVVQQKEDASVGTQTVSVVEELYGSSLRYTPWDGKGVVSIHDVPGDGNCFFHCLALFLRGTHKELREAVRREVARHKLDDQALHKQLENGVYSETQIIAFACKVFKLEVKIFDFNAKAVVDVSGSDAEYFIELLLLDEHFTLCCLEENCIFKSIADCLGRSIQDVIIAMGKGANQELYKSVVCRSGVDVTMLEAILTIFGIEGHMAVGGDLVVLNEGGRIPASFVLSEKHVAFKSLGGSDKPLKVHRSGLSGELIDVNVMPVRRKRSNELVLKVAGSSVDFIASKGKASLLSRSLHQGSTGLICSELFSNHKEIDVESLGRNDGFNLKVNLILGTFGSGKSTVYKKFLCKSIGKHVVFVSPRRVLADMFREIVNDVCCDSKEREKWKIMTFEVFALKMSSITGATVIIDEIQLFPPGYLDLICFCLRDCNSLYLAGDPCQSDYDNERDRGIFGDAPSDIERVLTMQCYRFATLSYRFLNADFLGRLPCDMLESGFTINEPCFDFAESYEDQAIYEGYGAVLVSSFNEKTAFKCLVQPAVKVLTFGESTGLTYDKVVIVISEPSMAVSENRWVTALSRARKFVRFVLTIDCHASRLAAIFEGRHLGRFLTREASARNLSAMLPGNARFVKELMGNVGASQGVFEEKLRGDPWLKSQLFLGQDEDVQEADVQEYEGVLQIFKTHIPRCEMEGVRAEWVHKFMSKDVREKRIGYLVSEQFADQHSRNRGKHLTNAAERFEAIYPKHKNSDTVTFIMGARKRLRFSKPSVEMRKYVEARVYGEMLLKEFLKRVPLKRKHDPNMMAEALRDFELKKVSKSAAVIENHAGRSCRDWLIDTGLVFMKSQHCTKYEKRFTEAKAAQSIVCFQHSVLIRFAPYMRYIEKKLKEAIPGHYYIHSGKGLDELNKWVKEYGFNGVCTESDYEAFDASQDEYILAFEVKTMEYLGIPKDLIADYIFIKTHLGSKLGNFAIMRFSGEASTFLFNTMANMLFTFIRYDLNGKEAICFAGDDMCASKRLKKSERMSFFLDKLKLKAKVCFTEKPTFCGWNLCSDGIYKKPQLVYERLCIAKETNNLPACIDNYAIEVSYAYKLGELAINRMDDEEIKSYYNCVKVIIKNKHLMKSSVADIFKSA
nr:replicase [Carnation latent virus]